MSNETERIESGWRYTVFTVIFGHDTRAGLDAISRTTDVTAKTSPARRSSADARTSSRNCWMTVRPLFTEGMLIRRADDEPYHSERSGNSSSKEKEHALAQCK